MKTVIVIENGRITLTTGDDREVLTEATNVGPGALESLNIQASSRVAQHSTSPAYPNPFKNIVDKALLLAKAVDEEKADSEKMPASATQKVQRRKCEVCLCDISDLNKRAKICKKEACKKTRWRLKAREKYAKKASEPKPRKLSDLSDESDTPIANEEWCTRCQKFTKHSAEQHDRVVPGGEPVQQESSQAMYPPAIEPPGELVLFDDKHKFLDPWDCLQCRDLGDECNLHYSMHVIGKRPPEIKTEIRR